MNTTHRIDRANQLLMVAIASLSVSVLHHGNTDLGKGIKLLAGFAAVGLYCKSESLVDAHKDNDQRRTFESAKGYV